MWSPYGASKELISLSPTPPNPNQEIAQDVYEVPSKVMETALSKATAEENLTLFWEPDDPTTDYYVYMHFAEITRLLPNQTRAFNIDMNDKPWYDQPVSPVYFTTNTIYALQPASKAKWKFTLFKTQNSTLPPLINAIEIYTVKSFLKSETRQSEGNY